MIKEALEVHDTLNPKLWDGDKLKPIVSKALIAIYQEFLSEVEENKIPLQPLDVYIVGSNASFNYTDNSDLDLHIIVNDELSSCDKNTLSLLYNFFKSYFNDKYDITVKGIPVEVYIEGVNTTSVSNGIYSLLNDEWIKYPEKIIPPEIDITDDLNKYEKQYKEIMSNKDYEEAQNMVDFLYLLRKNSIATEGEFGEGNQIFKEFRNKGCLDNLKELVNDGISDELTLEGIQ